MKALRLKLVPAPSLPIWACRVPKKLKIKSGLVIEITRAVRMLDLTQEEASRRMGIPQPKVPALLRGDFASLSERKLMDCLNRLGYDIEIKVKLTTEPVGHLTLAIA